MYIYLDESGDLGFDFSKKGTTKHFLITIMLSPTPRRIAKSVKHLKRTSLGNKYNKIPEIKFHNSPDSFRKRVVTTLSQQDISVLVFCLNKAKVNNALQSKKDKIYNYVTGLLMDKIPGSISRDKEIIFSVDKTKVGKIQIQDFNFYISMKLSMSNQPDTRLEINHVDSAKDPCIQAVDFISGGIFKKYERNDLTYYNLISNKIISETFWPK